MLGEYNHSVLCYEQALQAQPGFEQALRRKHAVLCQQKLEQRLEAQHRWASIHTWGKGGGFFTCSLVYRCCSWRLTVLCVPAHSLLTWLHFPPVVFIIHVGLCSGLWMSWKSTRSSTITTSTSRRPWTSTSCFRKSRYFAILSTKPRWPKKPSWVWQHFIIELDFICVG